MQPLRSLRLIGLVVQSPGLEFAFCVRPQFSHLQNGPNDSSPAYLRGFGRSLRERMAVKTFKCSRQVGGISGSIQRGLASGGKE